MVEIISIYGYRRSIDRDPVRAAGFVGDHRSGVCQRPSAGREIAMDQKALIAFSRSGIAINHRGKRTILYTAFNRELFLGI